MGLLVDFEVLVFEEAGKTRIAEQTGRLLGCLDCRRGAGVHHVVVATLLEHALGASAFPLFFLCAHLLGESLIDLDGNLLVAADA